MRTMTVQLFEYLLAAKNSILPINHNLNGYSTCWFLDELLSSKGARLVADTSDGSSYIEIYRPVLEHEEVEVSLTLAAVFKLLQYDDTTDESLNVASEELEEILLLEYESLAHKISSEDKASIILNDWQQLLLGVTVSKIRIEVAMNKFDQCQDVMLTVINEYKDWKSTKDQMNHDKKQVVKAQMFYDYVIDSNPGVKKEQQLYLGIGILYVQKNPTIYHPLLTLEVNIEMNEKEEVCCLKFAKAPLKVDPILDHMLFYELDAVKELKAYIEKSNMTPFDDELIADILKKVSEKIHPHGKYFSSPLDAATASDGTPQLLHRSVLFLRQDKPDELAQRLKSTINHLNYAEPSDVLGSIIDPNYSTSRYQDSEFLCSIDDHALFPMSSTMAEQNIIQLIQEHSAVAVFEAGKANKFPVLSNLITYLMSRGKRLLVVAEDVNQIDETRKLLPSYLNGLHTMVSNEPDHIELVKESLHQLLEGKEKHKNLNHGVNKVSDNIEKAKIQSDKVKKKIVDYRELSSKKVFWKEKRYFPYELAQLISKLGGFEQLPEDIIPITAKFEMKNSEIQKLWELRSYFTPENMDLLNYDFIDTDELMKYHGYQKLLVAEGKYLRLCSERGDLENMFEDGTDIRFVQYLSDQLPRLMRDVEEIKDPYGEKILKEAMTDLDSYHALAASVDRINRAIDDIQHLDGSKDKRDALIEKLNHLFRIETSELPIIFNYAHDAQELYDFYANKKINMTKALRVAHLIWIFNEGAFALSNNFKGIFAEGIGIMNILYHAAALHLSKVEVEIGWSRVRSHFIRVYQHVIGQEHIHPLCLDLYETLKHNSLSDFKEVLRELNDKMETRHKFITFGNFIAEIGHQMPKFTTKIMADIETELDTAPDFKAAFEQGKLNALFEQLKWYESELLEQKLDYFEAYKLELQHEFIEKECWRHKTLPDERTVLDLFELLGESLPSGGDLKKFFSTFPTVFIPLNQESMTKEIDSDQFDIVIFIDASSSDVFRLPDLMYAHKAILFGNDEDKLVGKEQLSAFNLRKLCDKYGQVLHKFGEQYLGASLFDLVAHSAAWDARVKLSQSDCLTLIKGFEPDIKKGIKKCDNVVEEEIFEALTKLGYDMRCKVKAGKLLLDFLIEGEDASLAINVVGDSQMQRKMIKKQLEQEIVLKNHGLNVYTVHAPNYYLNARKTLLNICAKLDELNIYPIK